MDVEVISTGGAGTVRLVGELDFSTIEHVRDALRELMPRTGDLTIDLSDLTFMGSQGIRLFIDLARERHGIGVIVLANPASMVRRVLDLTQLDRVPIIKIIPGT